jgi:endonuclease YncB( thermonuclease family)
MPLNIIKGVYRVIGREPDGDSVQFVATNPNSFKQLGIKARLGPGGGVQLRLDGIDALETHYTPQVPRSKVQHQPPEFADAAAAELLLELGFTNIERDKQKVVSATPETTDGYILTRSADKYGRPVALVFAGESDQSDLSAIFVDAEQASESANYHLLKRGLAYPTFYSELFPDIRQTLTMAVTEARQSGDGIWPTDATTVGFDVNSVESITADHIILPKLFRRLIDYLELSPGSSRLDHFRDFLDKAADRVIIASNAHITGFDTVIAIDGQKIRLTENPENLVFIEG